MGNAEFGEKPNWVYPFIAFGFTLLALFGVLLLFLWFVGGCACYFEVVFGGEIDSSRSCLGGKMERNVVVWIIERKREFG